MINRKEYKRAWRIAHSESEKMRHRKYRIANKEKVYEGIKNWHLKNKNWIKEYWQKKKKIDPNYILRNYLRSRLRYALKHNQKNGSAVSLLGCSVENFMVYLESKFTTGMSWSNHNLFGWHVDHIKPLVSFDLTDPVQLAEACHYTNLQPLWAKDNISKGSRLSTGG